MNSNLIAPNIGGGQEALRRMSSTSLARAPGLGKTEGVAGDAEPLNKLSLDNPKPGVIRDRGPVGRVATAEWQQKINISHGVGVADQAMGEIDEKVNEAKRDLIEMTKMFPPYPHGSEERAELLNSYRSLRLQIDKLTIPPESDLAAQILGGSGDDLLPAELQGFQVSSGKEGLDLVVPQVAVDDLEDDMFPALIEDLDRASAALKDQRMNLQVATGGMFKQKDGDEGLFISLSLELREQLGAVDATMGREKTGLHNDFPHLDWGE